MVIIDARKLSNGDELATDICIIGAGAAGITIARELVNTSHKVCIVESGGFSFDQETQSLYDIENVGYPQLSTATPRIRYFGGSTNTWTGRCLKLSPIDFEARQWVPNSGWPISYNDLQPYYDRAANLFNIPDLQNINAEFWQNKPALRDEKQLLADGTFAPVLSLFGKSSVRFGPTYRKQLEQSRNIDICLHANVTDIEASDNLTQVTRLHLACLHGPRFFVKAKIFILACGGLENARILLLSRNQQPTGLGNQFDTVGRYYMDHPNLEHGIILTNNRDFNAPLLFAHRIAKGKVQIGLRLSEAVQRREQVLNHYMLLQPHFSPDSKQPQPSSVINKLLYFYRKLAQKSLRFNFLLVRNYLEQRPDPESRVMLSEQRDKLGLNLLKLDWRVSSQERRDLHQFHQILGTYLEKHQIGRLEHFFPVEERSQPLFLDHFHHIGTTRMSDRPQTGVVDRNCQMHGINNLFIAGSSVFPTSGHANPTLTIAALAIRLADHIKQLP
ncbi:MAG: GMC family oxidoreductase [Kovacikia sp.]